MSTTLVLGAARSGKSRHAESLLPREAKVTFVVPGKPLLSASDTGWDPSVQENRHRRPDAWETVETTELARVLMAARAPVLLDCLGSWVAAVVDEAEAWDDPARSREHVNTLVDELLVALVYVPFDIVAVSTETGWGSVEDSPANLLHRDLLAVVNRRVSAAAQRVHLVVAGRVIDLTDRPIAEGASQR